MRGSLLAELKRRRVFRVAAVYGATGFVVLQAADLLFPRLGLPDWSITLLVALGLCGLPVALALAWAFDATPDGLRRTGPAEADELAAIAAQPRSRRWGASLGALAGVSLLAIGTWWTLVGAGERAAVYDSIAVLPFVNLSGDPANDYFGDGLAEELLNALSGIEGLKVAARTSAFAFRGGSTDVRAIGDTLRVAAVLEGSVRRSADRIRIAAQLIDARSGYRLWSESYDRPLADLFAVQDAIASEIVNALAVRLTGVARADGLYRGGTTDIEAYDLYLLGRQKWATRQIPLLHQAVEHFEQAIARDSSFALAWSGLADAIDALAWRRAPSALARLDDAKYAAQRAILLDPQLAEGWASLGVLALDFDRDWRVAELALRRAVELKPSYAMANNWLSDALLYSGRPDESLLYRRRAFELDPLSGVLASNYAWALAVARQWEGASAAYRALGSDSDTSSEVVLLALTSARPLGFSAEEAAVYAERWARLIGFSRPAGAAVLGRAIIHPERRELHGAAAAVLRELESEGAPPRDLAGLYSALNDHESAIRVLEKARDDDDPQLFLVAFEPNFEPLRADPRFERLLEARRMQRVVIR